MSVILEVLVLSGKACVTDRKKGMKGWRREELAKGIPLLVNLQLHENTT